MIKKKPKYVVSNLSFRIHILLNCFSLEKTFSTTYLFLIILYVF